MEASVLRVKVAVYISRVIVEKTNGMDISSLAAGVTHMSPNVAAHYMLRGCMTWYIVCLLAVMIQRSTDLWRTVLHRSSQKRYHSDAPDRSVHLPTDVVHWTRLKGG